MSVVQVIISIVFCQNDDIVDKTLNFTLDKTDVRGYNVGMIYRQGTLGVGKIIIGHKLRWLYLNGEGKN